MRHSSQQKDIAAAIGVSVSTVSLALSGKGEEFRISPETILRIQQAAKDMAYRVDRTARSLRTRRYHTIGLLFHSTREPLYAELIPAIQTLLARHDYAVVCSFWNRTQDVDASIHAVLDHGVDGIITCHDYRRFTMNLPVVFFAIEPDSSVRDGICLDRSKTFLGAVKYLLDLGHRRLMAVNSYNESAELVALLAQNNATLEQATVEGNGIYDTAKPEFAKKVSAFASRPQSTRPTGLICRNDAEAIRTIALLQRSGLDVPKDVSVAGFDAIDQGSWTNPPLTTFGIPSSILAQRLVDKLLARIERPEAPPNLETVVYPLLERGSCAAPSV